MLRYLTIFFLLTSYGQLLHAQKLSFYPNYQLDNFYNINPAAAGYDGSFISRLTVSKKWFGIIGSPSGQILSNSVRLGEEEFYDPQMFINRPFINLAPHVGLGLTIFNESSGPLRHTGALFAYAYHISINQNRLSLGLSAQIVQYKLNTQEFKPVNEADPSLYTNPTVFVPDFNFGALYYNRKMFAGISAIGLVNFNKVMDHAKTFPDIVAYGGFLVKINSIYKFEPSLFLWKYGQGKFVTDINTKFYYRDKNWLMLSYQGKGEALAGIGLNIKTGIQICYSYAINTKGLANYNAGSQSISLRVDVAALAKKRN
jgi:type IX secretion system PorP/SprF family membrane protein